MNISGDPLSAIEPLLNSHRGSKKCQDMRKNAHYNFWEPKVTSSDCFFGPTYNPKQKTSECLTFLLEIWQKLLICYQNRWQSILLFNSSAQPYCVHVSITLRLVYKLRQSLSEYPHWMCWWWVNAVATFAPASDGWLLPFPALHFYPFNLTCWIQTLP